jgi:uncharacterized protein YndB with AHSA1/START domain
MPDKALQEALRGERDLWTERLVAHPPSAVYAAFVDAQRLSRWWGPAGFTNRTRDCDLRPGGDWNVSLVGPDGKQYENLYRFVELAEPSRFVMEHLTVTGSGSRWV